MLRNRPTLKVVNVEGAVRGDGEVRQMLDRARSGFTRYGFGETPHPVDLARPWSNGRWQDAQWLRGVRDLLAWVAGDRDTGPLAGVRAVAPSYSDLCDDLDRSDEIMRQGLSYPVTRGLPPPQTAEGAEAAFRWLVGWTDVPPVCEHCLGVYGDACSVLFESAAAQ